MKNLRYMLFIVLLAIPRLGGAYYGNYEFESEMNSIQQELRDIENNLEEGIEDIKDILDPSPYVPYYPILEEGGCPLHSRSYTPKEVYGDIDAEISAILSKSLMGRAQQAEQFRDFPIWQRNRLIAEQMGRYASEIADLREVKKQRIEEANGKCTCELGYVADKSKAQCVREGQPILKKEPSITPTSRLELLPTLPPDIHANDWYADVILDFVEAGYLDSSQSFRPTDAATRADFIKLIVELNGGVLGTSPTAPSFDDVGISNPYFEHIEEAALEGWVVGQGNCYRSHPCIADVYGSVNRAEAATLINRVFQVVKTELAPLFSDNFPNQWFTEGIQTAADNCILQGDAGSSRVRPEATLNRAEMIVMLHRVDQGLQYPNCR